MFICMGTTLSVETTTPAQGRHRWKSGRGGEKVDCSLARMLVARLGCNLGQPVRLPGRSIPTTVLTRICAGLTAINMTTIASVVRSRQIRKLGSDSVPCHLGALEADVEINTVAEQQVAGRDT